MATTRITDVIDPEVLSDMIINQYEDKLFMLPGVSNEVSFPIPTKGTLWEIPYADVLGDLETFIAGTPLTIQSMTQDVFRSVVIRKGGLYGVDKIVKLAGLKNPMDYFAEQFSNLMLKANMETQIAVLTGAIPSANINNQTGVSVSEAIIQATKQKLVDMASDLKYFVCHSAIYATLEAGGKITWQPASQVLPVLAGANNSQVIDARTGMVPTIAGMIIVQSDKCTYSSPDYFSFLLGEKSMGLFYQQTVNFDTDRDISLKEDYISPDFDFVMPVYGVDYTKTDYTIVELEKTANYALKWDRLICTP